VLTIASDDAPNTIIDTTSHLSFFRGTAKSEMSYFEQLEFDAFDFGYVITVHKAQGSQWPSVIVFDESKIFGQKWLYTAITRASKIVTVVLL
jgi:exodeoxyribonuclease-5